MFASAPMALLQESDQTWGYSVCTHSLSRTEQLLSQLAPLSLPIDHGL